MTEMRAVLTALVFWGLTALCAAAQTFPALSGRVVDQANILSPEAEARLSARSAALEQQNGAQLVVATVSSLEDYPIEDYANRLFRAWRLGQREQNNGVLFLVAPNDRGVRIEVGYGLEPLLTDALSSVIIQGQVLPQFRQGEMEAGVLAGAEAIAGQLGLDPASARARVAAAEAQRARAPRNDGGGAAGVFITLLILWLVFSALASFGRRGRRHRRRGGVAGDVAQVVLWSMLNSGGRGGGGGWGGGGFGGGGGFSGGGGSSGGGGASGSW